MVQDLEQPHVARLALRANERQLHHIPVEILAVSDIVAVHECDLLQEVGTPLLAWSARAWAVSVAGALALYLQHGNATCALARSPHAES